MYIKELKNNKRGGHNEKQNICFRQSRRKSTNDI